MSTRFAVSTHLLVALAANEGTPISSAQLAESVNTSAAVVRQLLARLSASGLVDARLGAGGGSFLARPADGITLLDIYDAVETEAPLGTHRDPPGPECVCWVGQNMLDALEPVLEDAVGAMKARLAEETVASMLTRVEARRVEA